MEIIWYGHACFALITDATTIITDPFDNSLGLSLPALEADIVTISHDTPHHNAVTYIAGEYKTLTHPGEYEINEIFITGHALYPIKKEDGQDRNVIFTFEMDNLTVCHMGDVNHVPTPSQVETFANVDVLLIPVGGSLSLNAAQASEVVAMIEPAIVIPMHYQLPGIIPPLAPLDKFLKEMGLAQPEPQPKLKINSTTLPLETQTIILAPQQ